METESTESQSQRLLELSAHLLSLRDFPNSRKYALLAQQSDPNLVGPTQILSISDVLLAAGSRRNNHHHLDWYSILGVNRSDSDDRKLVWTQFKKLLLILNPIKNKFSFSDEAFNLACDEWSALSESGKKSQHENDVVNEQKPQEKYPTPEDFGEAKVKVKENVNGTFWTACPYCYYVYEYEKVYEDCCLRCQNCRRAFHGVPVAPPPIVNDGEGTEERYYWRYGLFPFGCSVPESKNVEEVVDIDDDSNESLGGFGTEAKGAGLNVNVNGSELKNDFGTESKGAGLNVNGNSSELKNSNSNPNNVSPEMNMDKVKVVQEEVKKENRKRPIRNVKTVARNTKKIMGTGMRRRRIESMGKQGNGGVSLNGGSGDRVEKDGNKLGGVEFFEVDEEIIVCIPEDAW